MGFQEQQVATQAATNEVLLKIGKASGEHRTRIKTEVSAVGAETAVTLFFELVDFDRNMTELQIGESDFGLKWRSLREKVFGAAKTMIEELEGHASFRQILETDTNEGFKTAFNTAISLFKSRKGLTPAVEQRLAKQ